MKLRMLTAALAAALLVSCARPEPQEPPPRAAEAPAETPGAAEAPQPPAVDPVALVRERPSGGVPTQVKLRLMRQWAEENGIPVEEAGWSVDEEEGAFLVRHRWETARGPRVWTWRVEPASGSVEPADDPARALDLVALRPEPSAMAELFPAAEREAQEPPRTAEPPPPAAAPPPPPPSEPPTSTDAQGEPPAAASSEVQLVGVMEIGGARKAILRIGDQHYTVQAAQSAGGYRVDAVGEGEVVLHRGGATYRVPLNTPQHAPRAGPTRTPPRGAGESAAEENGPSEGSLPLTPEDLEAGSGDSPVPRTAPPPIEVDGSGYPRIPENHGYPGQLDAGS